MSDDQRINVIPGSGRWFSQVAVDDVMLPLANEIRNRVPNAEGITVSYDPGEDLHHLRFSANGHTFDVRYYKVFSVDVDGKRGWCGCPIHREWYFVKYLADVAIGAANTED